MKPRTFSYGGKKNIDEFVGLYKDENTTDCPYVVLQLNQNIWFHPDSKKDNQKELKRLKKLRTWLNRTISYLERNIK